jgi:hypothetical protein
MMNLEKIRLLVDGMSPGAMTTLRSSEIAEMVAEIERLRGIVVKSRELLSILVREIT